MPNLEPSTPPSEAFTVPFAESSWKWGFSFRTGPPGYCPHPRFAPLSSAMYEDGFLEFSLEGEKMF